MHRFGRSAQQKMKDRWGGGFILATILALVGAWYAGTWLNSVWNGGTASGDGTPGTGIVTEKPMGNGGVSVVAPESFDLHLVQIGAFRSKDSAQKLVANLSAKGMNAMMTNRSGDGLYKVYGGLYTSVAMANEAKTSLAAEPGVTNPWVVKVSINQMPEAIPVASMKDSKAAADIKKGLETMTSYIYEAARWMENGNADTVALVAKGKELAQLAESMTKMNNTALAPYAKLAADAGMNATAIDKAAKAAVGSEEYITAMSGYLTLLDEYKMLASAAPAGN